MKRLIGLAILAGVLGSRSPASGQAAWTFNSVSGPSSSLRGFQIDGPGGNPGDQYSTPYGFLFTLYGGPVWGYGMNKTVTAGTASHDLFMQSYTVTNGQPVGQVLNVRSDNGQVSMGPGISTNTGSRQVQITAGTPTTPLAGLAVSTYGAQNGLVLLQGDGVTKRTQIDMDDLWYLGTDTGALPGNTNGNWYMLNNNNPQAPTIPLLINASTSQTFIRNGCEVDGALFHNGSTLGFYGATPQPKFILSGCRSDGTALANLIQKLQAIGLLTDQTTP